MRIMPHLKGGNVHYALRQRGNVRYAPPQRGNVHYATRQRGQCALCPASKGAVCIMHCVCVDCATLAAAVQN